jgi:hypothetical protein
VVSFTPQPLYSQGKSPWCPLDRRLVGPQSRSGRGGDSSIPLVQLLVGLARWLFNKPTSLTESRDSSVGIALGYELGDRGSRVRFPAGAGNFSLHHRVQNVSGAHPASYTMGTRDSFPGGKAAERAADRSPSSSAEVKEDVKLYLHSADTPSWRGAQLKNAQGHHLQSLLRVE